VRRLTLTLPLPLPLPLALPLSLTLPLTLTLTRCTAAFDFAQNVRRKKDGTFVSQAHLG
jgi:hypothetical protein